MNIVFGSAYITSHLQPKFLLNFLKNLFLNRNRHKLSSFFANMRKECLNSVYKFGEFACYILGMMKKNANLSLDSTYYIYVHTYLRNLSIFFCHALLLVRKRITPYSAKDENTKSMQTKTHKSIAFM